MQPRSERFRSEERPSAERRTDAAPVELHALRWGDAALPKLVMLHGGGANAHWWDHLAPRFVDRFEVVALDFRGHGDSQRPDELVVGSFARDLESLLEHLGTRNVVLVGHSMGAHIAEDYAVAHPEALRALVLIDPSRGGRKGGTRRMRLALTFRRTYPSREEATQRYRFLPPAEHASEALRAAIARESVEQGPDGRWGYKFDPRWFGLPSRGRSDLRRITCPVLVLRGAESEILSAKGASTIRGELRDGRLEVIEGAGHHVQLDQPDAVVRAISAFLGALSEPEELAG